MSIYDKASLVQIPSGYKASAAKLYSVVPSSGDGDFTISADADATRVNKDGLIETTVANQARLNYDFANPQDPHLLLEPTRTQLAEYTNAISSANGYSLTNGTLTTDSHTAPDGSNEASTFEATSANGQFQKVKVGSSGVEYTVSAYVKRKTGTGTVYLRAVENTNTAVTVTDEWTRVSLTATSTSTNIRYGMALATSGDEIYVWGFQVEAGSYATSLIPNTSTGQVTRTVDSIDNIGGVTVNSDFTYFVHIKNFDDKTLGNYPIQFFLRESASPFSYFRFLLESNERFYAQLRNNNTATTVFNTSSDTLSNLGDDIKLAFAKSGTNCKYYVNGSLVLSSTITDFSYSFDRINYTTGNDQPTKLSQIMVFNEALSDSELIQITS